MRTDVGSDAEGDVAPDNSGSGRNKTHPAFRVLQLAALAALLGLLALLVWRFFDANRGAELVKAIKTGKRPVAPAFTLPLIWTHSPTWPAPTQGLLDQREIALRQLRGDPVVLNFWASWCGPCKKEAPLLNQAARAHKGEVVFLGIDVQDLKSDARSFLRHHDLQYASLHDNSGVTYDGYGLTGVPETYWINARGRIVSHYAGPVTAGMLESGIRKAERARRER